MTKISATQEKILKAAANREDGAIHPFPSNIKGGAAKKVTKSLKTKGLADHIDGDETLPITITEVGYQVIGLEPPAPEAKKEEAKPVSKTRSGTKQAMVIEMLKRPQGATSDEIMERTAWKKHTVRGFISGAIKKKLGLNVVSEKNLDGVRVYKILG